jgi:hypothetical protein
MNYAQQVESGRQLLHMASRAELESSAAYWELAELTYRVTESGVTGRRWAKDIGCSPARVSLLRAVWRRFGDRRNAIRFTDAVQACHNPKEAEQLIVEAQALGLSVSGLRQRKLKGTTRVPSQRIQDPILKNVVASRSAILRALDAVSAGRLPEDSEAVRDVVEEIRDHAGELFSALRSAVSLVG